MDASAHPFAGQDACVSYAAHDGTMFPCVAGNVYPASASGTSVESLTYPKAPGIPVSSATVERTSTCP
jgi:hypothetical protein